MTGLRSPFSSAYIASIGRTTPLDNKNGKSLVSVYSPDDEEREPLYKLTS